MSVGGATPRSVVTPSGGGCNELGEDCPALTAAQRSRRGSAHEAWHRGSPALAAGKPRRAIASVNSRRARGPRNRETFYLFHRSRESSILRGEGVGRGKISQFLRGSATSWESAVTPSGGGATSWERTASCVPTYFGKNDIFTPNISLPSEKYKPNCFGRGALISMIKV